ncbi:hypothetical protein [Mesorhizobium sp. WSM4884]|nr:hypothetical protein [Mesorhizobium sp. WSM4884]MDG4880810.1 hypothetical protein [Mesorhizobium sp. WSM4884]
MRAVGPDETEDLGGTAGNVDDAGIGPDDIGGGRSRGMRND